VLADSREGHMFGLGRTRVNLGWSAMEEGGGGINMNLKILKLFSINWKPKNSTNPNQISSSTSKIAKP
jgi:hypothetical protein